MAHIELPSDHPPGIVGLLNYRPATARQLRALAEILLRGPSTLSSGEREIIASSVSWWNGCHFCHTSHGAAASAHLGRGSEFIDAIKEGLPDEPLSAKLRALLTIAHQVQRGGRHVTKDAVDAARGEGASDLEIHDTVLIAASFCMFNRYVDGLGTWAPGPNEAYVDMGQRLANEGYLEGSAAEADLTTDLSSAA